MHRLCGRLRGPGEGIPATPDGDAAMPSLSKPRRPRWPHGRKAAFTLIDDTDDAVCPDIARTYAHVVAAGMRTTKTVWVEPVRDTAYFRGHCLRQDAAYRRFIGELQALGFEIGLHGVGSGDFVRAEIESALEFFRETLGHYPRLHVNHSYNKDSIHGGDKRFGFPFNLAVRLLHRDYRGFEGEVPGSPHYWGDLHKRHIAYSRAYEVDRLNLLELLPFPYRDARYADCCNAFYPAAFCPNPDLFARMVTPQRVERLIRDGGCAILYTHLGYFTERGGVDARFVQAMKMLQAHAAELWFAPVGAVLDHLAAQIGPVEISRAQRLRIEALCLWTRLKYRYLLGLDDYHYKKSLGGVHRAMAACHE